VTLPPVEDDPRLLEAVEAFNRRDYFEAGDAFEELFFEAVRDEVPFIRALLQVSVGLVHAERGQRKAAIERLEEALAAFAEIVNARGFGDRGFDFARLESDVRAAISALRAHRAVAWPTIAPRAASR